MAEPAFDTIEERIMDRLRLCDSEISGVRHAFMLAPASPISDADLPASYGLPGAQAEPSEESNGLSTQEMTFIRRVLVLPGSSGVDHKERGSEASVKALKFIGLFRRYYLSHGTLFTSQLPPLAGVSHVYFTHSGLAARIGPGGAQYFAVDIFLTVRYSERIPSVRIPMYD